MTQNEKEYIDKLWKEAGRGDEWKPKAEKLYDSRASMSARQDDRTGGEEHDVKFQMLARKVVST